MANPDIFTYGVATRFQPGASGNKKGRPKGSLNITTLVQQLLGDEDIADKVIARKPSYWQYLPNKNFATAIVVVMIIKAINGDVKAATWIRKTGYGDKIQPDYSEYEARPIQTVDLRTGQKMKLVPDNE